MAEGDPITRCTWEGCDQYAVTQQIGRNGEVWATLCAAHDQKLQAVEKSGRSPQIMSCWAKAQSGFQTATTTIPNPSEKPMTEGDPVNEVPPVRPKYRPRPRQPRPLRPSVDPTIEQVAQSTGISSEQLIEALRALGQELRRPDPETEAQRAAEKLRLQLAKQHERQVIMEHDAKVKLLQEACARNGHRMDGGRANRSAISGQIHSDGKFHGICVECQFTFVRQPNSDEMSMGVMT